MLFIFLFERKVVGLDENTLGIFCTWKSDINRNKAPTENELGHMPRRPDAVACGPGHCQSPSSTPRIPLQQEI